MDLRLLKTFFYVVETKSFSGAAKWCNITKSAVSQNIKTLEDELHTTLLLRTSKGIQLTESGEVLFEHAKVLLKEAQYTVDHLASIEGELRGTLRLGIGSFISPYIRKTAVEMMKRYPNVKLIVEYGTAELLNKKLRSHELDLAFTMNVAEENEGIMSTPCIPFRLKAIMNDTHPLANKKVLTFEDIKHHYVILQDAGRRVYTTMQRFAPNIDLNNLKIAAIVNSAFEILRVLEQEHYISILPELYVRNFRTLRAISIEGFDNEMQFNAHYMKDAPLKKSAQVFLEIIRDEVIPYYKALDV